ncbi:MAG: hypothetical protein FJZ01_07280 [Candidatus Sericytochromatia bacterium]|nr:hypothetical protein [Candidatus Tanganyikabacteria bacterium]
MTAEVSVAGAKALDDVHERLEAEFGPLTRGEVIERLALDALARMGREDGDASASIPADRREAGQEAGGDGSLGECERGNARRGAPQRGRRERRRTIEIVYRSAETGERWLPSRHGPAPLIALPCEIQERLAMAPSVVFEELRARALAASARHERSLVRRVAELRKTGRRVPKDMGREVPAAVALYLMGRSAGICEKEGCAARAVDFHHLDPFCESRRHDIDRMLAVCWDHHGGYHLDELEPDPADPRRLRAAKAGADPRRRAVNAKVAACRRRATDRADSGPPGAKA